MYAPVAASFQYTCLLPVAHSLSHLSWPVTDCHIQTCFFVCIQTFFNNCFYKQPPGSTLIWIRLIELLALNFIMGIDLSTWKNLIGSFYNHADHNQEDSKPSKIRRAISPSLQIVKERQYPQVFLFSFVPFVFFCNILFALNLHWASFETPLLTKHQPNILPDKSFIY